MTNCFKLRYILHIIKCTDLNVQVKASLTNVYTCATVPQIKTLEHCQHPWKSLPVPLQSLLPPSSGTLWLPFCHYRLVLPVLQFSVNRILQYVLFLWLVSFTQRSVFLRFFLWLCQSSVPLHCSVVSTVRTDHNLFFYFVDGCLGYCHFLTIMNTAAGTFLYKLLCGASSWVNTSEWNCRGLG